MLTLLEMSLYGGVLVIIVALLRLFALNRLPKRTLCLLWCIALARLLLPFSLPSPTSIYAAPAVRPLGPPALLLLGAQAAPKADCFPAEKIIWVAGAVIVATYLLITHLRGRKRYCTSLPLEHSYAKNWLDAHRLRRPIQLRYSDQIDTPLTYGFFWPVILLPKRLDWDNKENLAFILAHEVAHIRRFDALWKWLLAAVLCLHWFNPLVWLMYFLSNRDLELASDEAVLRDCGFHARHAYALALVSLEEKRGKFTPLASSFNRNALKERVVAVMRTHHTTIFSLSLALILVCSVALVFATSAPAEKPRITEALSQEGALEQVTVQDDGISQNETGYKKEEYEKLIQALQTKDYQAMSIAVFNRKINALLTDAQDSNSLMLLYETVTSALPDNDPNAAFLRNTVRMSLQEYQARLEEVYSGKTVNPTFWAQAYLPHQKIEDQENPEEDSTVQYTVAYRILDQDKLTVGERDAFIQSVMDAAQNCLKDTVHISDFQEALDAAGAKLSGTKIAFVNCTLENMDVYTEIGKDFSYETA